MGKKDDMRAALERRQPQGAVPLWEMGFHCWDQVSGQHVVLGREFEALTPRQQQRALGANAEVMARVCDELHFAALRVPGGYWETAPGQPTYFWLPEPARWRQVEALGRAVGDDLMLIDSSGGVISPPSRGFVEFCYKLFDAPEEVDEMARRTLAAGLDAARRMRDLGVKAVVTASDIANNHGPFFNPQQMERFVMPCLREWAERVRKMGLYSIMHTDGDLNPCLEDIASSGIDALQAIDPVAGMDIADVKRRVAGRICLCGNVDCGLLLLGPAEKVYAQTRQILQACKPGGAFVLGASNAVVQETPIENYLEVIRAWRDHGQYGPAPAGDKEDGACPC
jgi:uroporphyrinogen decarboxylase